jgi:hypothetical protein
MGSGWTGGLLGDAIFKGGSLTSLGISGSLTPPVTGPSPSWRGADEEAVASLLGGVTVSSCRVSIDTAGPSLPIDISGPASKKRQSCAIGAGLSGFFFCLSKASSSSSTWRSMTCK